MRVSADLTSRLLGSKKNWDRGGAQTSRLQSFETGMLAGDEKPDRVGPATQSRYASSSFLRRGGETRPGQERRDRGFLFSGTLFADSRNGRSGPTIRTAGATHPPRHQLFRFFFCSCFWRSR